MITIPKDKVNCPYDNIWWKTENLSWDALRHVHYSAILGRVSLKSRQSRKVITK